MDRFASMLLLTLLLSCSSDSASSQHDAGADTFDAGVVVDSAVPQTCAEPVPFVVEGAFETSAGPLDFDTAELLLDVSGNCPNSLTLVLKSSQSDCELRYFLQEKPPVETLTLTSAGCGSGIVDGTFESVEGFDATLTLDLEDCHAANSTCLDGSLVFVAMGDLQDSQGETLTIFGAQLVIQGVACYEGVTLTCVVLP